MNVPKGILPVKVSHWADIALAVPVADHLPPLLTGHQGAPLLAGPALAHTALALRHWPARQLLVNWGEALGLLRSAGVLLNPGPLMQAAFGSAWPGLKAKSRSASQRAA